MKILLVSKYHYLRGGDCTHVFALEKLLQRKGNDVRHFSMHHPKNLSYAHEGDFVSYIDFPEEMKKKGLRPKLKVLNRMLYSKEAREKFRRVINKFNPDVIHFHNIHKHLTTSILLEANLQRVPVVWTLHDYNLICPNILFLSNGKLCEHCRVLGYAAPVLKRCYGGSIAASSIIALEKVLHDLQGIKDRVRLFISPSKFLKQKFSEYGFPEEKIIVMPNFYDMKESAGSPIPKERYFLYLGRISEEKGIATLCDAAHDAQVPLIVAGDGPLRQELEKKHRNSPIRFMGHVSGNQLEELRSGAWFIIVPSECYENNPFSLIESFADQVPAIGADIGGIPELVINNKTGFLFESRNKISLCTVLKKAYGLLQTERDTMGKNSRDLITARSNPERYYDKLIKIYHQSIKTEQKKWKH